MQWFRSRFPDSCGLMLIVCALFLTIHSSQGKKLTAATEENCEVCVKFLNKFVDNLPSEAKGDPMKIEKELLKSCKAAKSSDNRFCYYIGGTSDAATSILSDLTKPLSWGVPANKVCFKIYKKDEQICDLKYEKQMDFVNANFRKLKVKDLKKILNDWEDSCRGCTEKDDYIRRIEELLPKYAPEAARAREARGEL